MDPVTAFSLAAGVLQVIDLGLKASLMCKEIYTDGSLAQHRDAAELTTFLAESTGQLEKSTQSVSRPVSEETKNVIEASKKCSAIAKELLAELRKLQSEPGDGLLQAIKKGTRAVRRKGAIKEMEKKLGKYQDTLHTRILSKLDAHEVQRSAKFETLDQNVKDLANQYSQGQNAVTQLLDSQTIERMKQQFKESLFFPEMFARQDDIPKSHKGTCHWIFGSSHIRSSDSSTSSDSFDDSDGSGSFVSSDNQDVPLHPWDNFMTWLSNDEDIYWLSGKPGSGKSTLMKYITSEFRNFCQSGATLPGWGTGDDLVTCSFFFWTLGNSLQKNYVGFLRSLLYQIAEQREDLIPLMVGQDSMPNGKTNYSTEPIKILAWTKERLDYSLKRFLSNKPSSISLCFFIDGLDEFVGDEDMLLETLRLLSGSPRTHVCVSSRPEQIFRQGFAQSPRLRLQDLNHQDIEKAVKDRLGATLSKKFAHSPSLVDEFVKHIVSRSEGIFLWTELIIKDLQRGVRNSDNLQELRERFDRMPDTIEGLYQHMLNRLERSYLQEAAKYFQLLMVAANLQEIEMFHALDLTLLHCACAEEKAWSKVLSHDVAYFQSPEFDDSCRNLETRILTRCTGLVEISEHRMEHLEGVWKEHRDFRLVKSSQEASSVSCFLREIRFIHKTVIEFLQTHEEFFQDLDWRFTASHTVTRGMLGVLSLTPVVICKEDARSGPLVVHADNIMRLVNILPWTEVPWPPLSKLKVTSDIANQVMSQTYEILGYVNENLNGADRSLCDFLVFDYKKPSWYIPFHDHIGFAAYVGQHEFISTYLAQANRSSRDVEYVIFCAFSGFLTLNTHFSPWSLTSALAIEGYCKIVLDVLKYSRNADVSTSTTASAVGASWNSKWVAFLDSSLQSISRLALLNLRAEDSRTDALLCQQSRHSIVLWKNAIAYFLEHDADVDISLYGDYAILCSDPATSGHMITFTFSESLLAWIERIFEHTEPEIWQEVQDVVKSHGGQHRRTILSIHIDVNEYPLTLEQSDRLLYAWAWEDGSLPETSLWNDFVRSARNGEELSLLPPDSPDPKTERKLKILLDNIDRFRVTKEFYDNNDCNYYTNLDFGD